MAKYKFSVLFMDDSKMDGTIETRSIHTVFDHLKIVVNKLVRKITIEVITVTIEHEG